MLQSPKYRDLCPELIARVGRQELQARRSPKDALKETKNALHQIAGAYLAARPRYADWLTRISDAQQADNAETFPEVCRQILRLHASTNERLPLLNTFYANLFAGLPPVRSVLDLACGLNPLAAFAMPLAPDAVYHAFDIYGDMMDFLTRCFALTDLRGQAYTADVAAKTDFPAADVALVLKFLPVLEQQSRNTALHFLHSLPAPVLLVSFPTRTLGGHGRGMTAHYETRFMALIAAENWHTERFIFPGELVFRVTK